MVAAGYNVRPKHKKRAAVCGSNTAAVAGVFAVDYNNIGAVFLPKFRHFFAKGGNAGASDDVAYTQNAHKATPFL